MTHNELLQIIKDLSFKIIKMKLDMKHKHIYFTTLEGLPFVDNNDLIWKVKFGIDKATRLSNTTTIFLNNEPTYNHLDKVNNTNVIDYVFNRSLVRLNAVYNHMKLIAESEDVGVFIFIMNNSLLGDLITIFNHIEIDKQLADIVELHAIETSAIENRVHLYRVSKDSDLLYFKSIYKLKQVVPSHERFKIEILVDIAVHNIITIKNNHSLINSLEFIDIVKYEGDDYAKLLYRKILVPIIRSQIED